jgi:phosphatidylinositol alpha-1,6-mannosyltransferase
MFVISTRNFPPEIGGMQNLMGGLSLSLLKHGPVKVFADKTNVENNFDKNSGINITRVSGFKIFRKYRKANLIKEFSLKNSIRAFFFDHWKSIEKIDDKILANTTSFCLIHSKEINHVEGTLINKRMLKALNKASYVISNSEFTKKLAINNGLNEKKIKIIHPGCNYPIKIDNKNLDKAKDLFRNNFPKIITVARLDKRKSHQNILMTIKNLKPRFPNIKYISIGDGDEMQNLRSLKNELGLGNEVLLLNESTEQLKIALLEQSDLFLMPSVIYKKSVEGFGISFIEAAAFGTGSIGGIAGGASDAIQDGVTGYLCDGNDLNSIYETIVKFYDNDNFKQLGKNAFTFSKNFNWDKIIKKYIKLI